MPFLQLEFETDALAAENLESACLAAGAFAVTLSDAADAPIFEPEPGATPLWPKVRISSLYGAAAQRARITEIVTAALGSVPPGLVFSELADRIWERECLADFRPICFGARLWICPHEQSVPAGDAVVVKLEPGLAFGTGTHATTALCLEWLDAARLSGSEVIDYGCGSGILAIAAVKLGARRALAVDHDAQALLAAGENAERNGVAQQVEISESGAILPRTDVLLANILAQPLIELAARFQTLLRPGGHLVLSGILREQAQAVAVAYRPWFEISPPVFRDDWVRLDGVRH